MGGTKEDLVLSGWVQVCVHQLSYLQQVKSSRYLLCVSFRAALMIFRSSHSPLSNGHPG